MTNHPRSRGAMSANGRKSFIEVAMMGREAWANWMNVVCPSCNYHSPLMVAKDSLDPNYMFHCDRFETAAPVAKYPCTARFSIAKEVGR